MTTSASAVNPINFKSKIEADFFYYQFHPTLIGVDPPFDFDADIPNAAFVQTCNKTVGEMRYHPLLRTFKQHLLICSDGYKLLNGKSTKTIRLEFTRSPVTEISGLLSTGFLPGQSDECLRVLAGEIANGFASVLGDEPAEALGKTGTFKEFWQLFSSLRVSHLEFLPRG